MTIQEELKLESKISTVVMLIAWMAMLILMLKQPPELEPEMMVATVIFATAYIFKRYLITCPQCEKSVASSAIKHRKHLFFPDPTYRVINDKCRECGCDFLQDTKNFENKSELNDENQ